MNSTKPILPGQTIGIFGGGQLGRMLAMVARRTGYHVHVFTPEDNSPAAAFATAVTRAAYDDREAFCRFASQIDVMTLEFENVSAEALDWLPPHVPVRPGKKVLATAQDRAREKAFLREHKIPCPDFAVVQSLAELESALQTVSCPTVLKTSNGGYDGKGQFRIDNARMAAEAWAAIGEQPATLEAFVDLDCEVSVIVARDVFGELADFGVIENRHVNHILDLSFTPSHLTGEAVERARTITAQIANALELVGLICIEFFISKAGEVLVNEIAPRPHNSGHLTIEAFSISQFEQQLRCVCGLPVATPKLVRPAAMVNLLGDLWQPMEPNWQNVANIDEAYLHLYDKTEPRAGRKMGHITSCAPNVTLAIERATQARKALGVT